ncbi:hypothetical protein HJP15_07590 [Pseudoalteromonas sp. NEC-BIFX-2020_002]|uniref:hypothetical protein n=1 Tax=Pseudoalteromonas sp. NEC-BIFX-2020_002 TaxID=2732353 RepID=UPI0014771A27|nr:hypothetical protein [Pseudoalteromonas sp. NEC-BIFX-2020_002]NNG42781.1 hypothetical protein [Pseudoalteromonas sp. NEC-BIFX-2020_002]
MSILSDLKEYFEIDDGYLPEIAFQGYMESEIIRVYNALTLISDRSSLDSFLWHLPTESEIKLSQFPCAAEMIINGEAEPFRMLFVKMTYKGVSLPDLGAFFSNNELIFDYRRGPVWSEKELAVLLDLINCEIRVSPSIVVKHEECEELFNLNLRNAL